MKKTAIISTMVIIALVSLLSGIEARTPLGKWKLIYLLAFPLALLVLATTSPREIKISHGLIFLALFYVVSTIPILFGDYDTLYLIRRALQITTLCCFGLLLCNIDINSLKRWHFNLALTLIACIMIFNVVWHLYNGFYSGWKRLGDPKTTFLFLPMCIAAGMVLSVLPNTKKWVCVWGLLCVIILVSGERKAFVSFMLLSFVMYLRLRSLATLVIMASLIVVAIGPLDKFTEGAVTKQLSSIISGFDPKNEVWYILIGGVPTSISDAARQFSDRVAWNLFNDSPLFGAGLDGTIKFHEYYLANYPSYLKTAVHNEFLRVLAEHGLFGFFFFLLPLLRSAIMCLYDAIWFHKRFGDYFYLRLILIIFIPSLTYMWSEGSGTEMLALTMIIALLPDLLPQVALRAYIKNRSTYSEARQDDVGYPLPDHLRLNRHSTLLL